MSSDHYVELHTGQKMPLVGLGTWKSEAGQVSNEFSVWENKNSKIPVAWHLIARHENTDCLFGSVVSDLVMTIEATMGQTKQLGCNASSDCVNCSRGDARLGID